MCFMLTDRSLNTLEICHIYGQKIGRKFVNYTIIYKALFHCVLTITFVICSICLPENGHNWKIIIIIREEKKLVPEVNA